MYKNITIYTTANCAYCGMVKKYLTSKSAEYTVVNLDEYPERRQEAISASGAMTVPITLITKANDALEVIVGWNPGKLAGALI